MNKSEINAFMANTRELTVPTVAEATALTFPNDGGDFWVRIEERGGAKFKASATGSGDGFSSLLRDDGGYLELDESVACLAAYGAKGDGAVSGGAATGTDDSAIVAAAFASGKPVIGNPSKLYRVSSAIVSGGSNSAKDVRLLIDDAVTTGLSLGNTSGDAVATTTIAADVTTNSRSITVADATGFEAGQLVTLVSTRIWPYDAPRNLNAGETLLIESVSGTTITFYDPLSDTYDISAETVTVKAYPPVTQYLDNVRVLRPSPIEKSGLSIGYSIMPTVKGFEAENCGQVGLNVSNCYMAQIKSPRLKHCYASGSATGYGIQDNAGVYTNVTGMRAYGCRRAIDFSGSYPSRHGSVSDFVVTGLNSTGSGLGTHGTAQHITFRDGVVEGSLIGLQIRGPDCVVDNVDCLRNVTPIVLSYTMSLTVKNSKQNPLVVENTFGSLAAIPARFIDVNNMPDTLNAREKLIVQGNSAKTRLGFIRFSGSLNSGIQHAVITDNFADIQTNASANDLSFVECSNAADLSNCRILRNDVDINGHTGDYSFYGSGNISIPLTAPNALQSVDLPITSLVKSSGTGTVTADNVDLRYDSDGQYVRVYGEVEFTVSGGSAAVKIEGVPQKKDLLDLGMPVGGLEGGTFSEVLVTKNNRLDIFLAYADFRTSGSPTEPFPIGTHACPIDIKYKARFEID